MEHILHLHFCVLHITSTLQHILHILHLCNITSTLQHILHILHLKTHITSTLQHILHILHLHFTSHIPYILHVQYSIYMSCCPKKNHLARVTHPKYSCIDQLCIVTQVQEPFAFLYQSALYNKLCIINVV